MSVESVEVEVLMGAPQGLECTGYFVLNERTAHLRESLYVAVCGDGEEYRPARWWEHFPILELHERGNSRPLAPNVGAKGRPVVFACYGAPGSGAAGAAADLVRQEARLLGPLMSGPLFGRMRAMAAADRRYRRLVPVKGPLHRASSTDPDPPVGSVLDAWRPPPGVLDPREEHAVPEVRSAFAVFEDKKREYLASWGLLDSYERKQRESAQRRREQAGAESPWQNPRPWWQKPQRKEDHWTQ